MKTEWNAWLILWFMKGELKKCLTGGFVTGKYTHGAAQLNRRPPHFYSGVYK
jgi:hypothetical protein